MSEQGDSVIASDAAAQIREDAAFAALEDSGAPIIAAAGEPSTVIFLNDSARAAFGADAGALSERLFRGEEEGARRLAELAVSTRHGAAPRLERLRFSFGPIAQTVTILCRKTESGLFLIAALGVRARPEAEPCAKLEPVIEAEPACKSEPAADLEPVLETSPPTIVEPEAPPTVAEASAEPESSPATAAEPAPAAAPLEEVAPPARLPRPERFLWRTDAEGRVVEVTAALADVVGRDYGDIVGRELIDTARRLRLDPQDRLGAALESRRSWSGVALDWPVRCDPLGRGARVPVTLGALPVFDDARGFGGFQGYGVLHVDRMREEPAPVERPIVERPIVDALEAEPPPVEELAARPLAEEPPPIVSTGGKVVPLRPHALAPRLEEAEPAVQSEALTPSERAAFDEISRALGSLRPGKGPRELIEAVEQGLEGSSAVEADDREHARLLDRLPVGVLVARGAQALYANRTLLDYLGYPDLATLEAEGGAARIFAGPRLHQDGAGGAGVVELRGRDGESLDVDARLQAIDWAGGPATLVTLRSARPSFAGAETARFAALQAEAGRRRREAEDLRAMLDATGAAVAVIDRDGVIRAASRGLARLLGEDADAIVGESLAVLFVEADQTPVADYLRRGPGRERNAEGMRVTSRSGPSALELTLVPFGSAAEQKRCAILRDGGLRRRSDEALEAARREAERANAAKTDFLAKVSHEVRTPLNAIIGFAEVMMEERFGPIGSERYKEYLKDIHTSGEHVLSLVNDLLDLSKIEAGKMELDVERIDANATIAECVSIMQPQASRSRVVIRLSLWPRLPRVLADGRSLRQILLNLLSNAVKFNEPGGQVIVSSALTDAGYVVIRVKDTGIGMSESEIETALEPFRQVSGSRNISGTGLGLPVTKALIEANRASFSIKSRKNEGTLVEVAFPPPQVLAAE
jgi:PAS domain S-box-containing protein